MASSLDKPKHNVFPIINTYLIFKNDYRCNDVGCSWMSYSRDIRSVALTTDELNELIFPKFQKNYYKSLCVISRI